MKIALFHTLDRGPNAMQPGRVTQPSVASRAWSRRRARGKIRPSVGRFESLESRLMLHATPLGDLAAEGEAAADTIPDFVVEDVNSTSATYEQQISPRDYLGKVSGWYFGYAT